MIPLMMRKGYLPNGWRKSEYGALYCCCAAVVVLLTCGNDDDRSGSDYGDSTVRFPEFLSCCKFLCIVHSFDGGTRVLCEQVLQLRWCGVGGRHGIRTANRRVVS
jgi:hypothetical protein|eukprot:COSAG02_NODE_472_length_21636_cov_767.911366_3_plen_105_part_00